MENIVLCGSPCYLTSSYIRTIVWIVLKAVRAHIHFRGDDDHTPSFHTFSVRIRPSDMFKKESKMNLKMR